MSELNIATSPLKHQALTIDKSIENPNSSKVNEAKLDKQEKELESNVVEKPVELTDDEISKSIDEMNSFLHNMKRNLSLSFSVDDDLGKSVITVKDAENDEVIRQIPSEELVVLRKKMDDVAGILFDTKV